jgi:exopolysaccharide biosynthesis polyprenyl glycosylphosphotransferase
MGKKMWVFTIALIIIDLFMFNHSFILGLLIRNKWFVFNNTLASPNQFRDIVLFGNFLLLVMFSIFKLYKQKRSLFNLEELTTIVKSVFFTFLILIAITYLLKTSIQYSRAVLVLAFFLSLALITTSRFILRKIQGFLRGRGFNYRNVLIVGKNAVGESILKRINQRPELAYRFKGFVDNKKGTVGSLSDLKRIIKRLGIEVVFIALPDKFHEHILDMVMGNDEVSFKIIPSMVEVITEPISFDEFGDMPLIEVRERTSQAKYLKIKRLIDVISSLILIVVLSPLFILFPLLIKLTSRGPILIKQKRVGIGSKPFYIYKFRTMVKDAEKIKKRLKNNTKGLFNLKNDPRITPIGKILRRFCLDEIPQLFNVLSGTMSLIGPRPHLAEEIKDFKGWRKKRLNIRPGMTGLWQISGRHELDFDRGVTLDLYYIKHTSLGLDLTIFLKTVPAIILSKGKW